MRCKVRFLPSSADKAIYAFYEINEFYAINALQSCAVVVVIEKAEG
jgi:hypothetical protein